MLSGTGSCGDPEVAASVMMRSLRPGAVPHMTWTGTVIAASDWALAVRSQPGTAVCHLTRRVEYRLGHWCVAVFPRGRRYNVMLDFSPDGQWQQTYVNIAEPARTCPTAIEWTDLYVDVIFAPGSPTRIVDVDELTAAIAQGTLVPAADRAVLTLAGQIARSMAPLLRPPRLEAVLGQFGDGPVMLP
ncbi:MAG: RNA-binding protein [Actinomycetia bacterium]|nr:RNA-binding protein [Actinomycetes bacterium]